MNGRRAGDLAGCLVHPVVHVDDAAEIEHGHQEDQEDDDAQGEFDERLAALTMVSARAMQDAHYGVTVTVREVVADTSGSG